MNLSTTLSVLPKLEILDQDLYVTWTESTNGIVTTTEKSLDGPLSGYHCGLVTLAALILLSNLFAILIYWRHKTIRGEASNVLLFSLAISDITVGLLVIPLLVVCESYHPQFRINETLKNMCRVHYLMVYFCGFSTIFHLTALTVDKYMAVLHPFRRMSLSSGGFYRKILVSVWVLALFFSLIPLFWLFKNDGPGPWKRRFRNYGILQIVVFFGVSVLVFAFCYSRMFLKIHAELSKDTLTGRVQSRIRNDRKTILVFLLFFTVFIVGWFPWFFFALDDKINVSLQLRDFLVTLRFAGSFLNPLIYAFLKSDYKQAIRLDLFKLYSRCPKLLQCLNIRPPPRSRSNTANQLFERHQHESPV